MPRWLATFGALEEVPPEPLLQRLKRLATLRRPPGHDDPVGRRAHLARIGQ